MATSTQAPVQLTKGTIEPIPVRVNDALGLFLTTLDGTDLRYDIYRADQDEETEISLNSISSNNGMIAMPLIDTTDLDRGHYNLYISFEVAPQTVRLGPFRFIVGDG